MTKGIVARVCRKWGISTKAKFIRANLTSMRQIGTIYESRVRLGTFPREDGDAGFIHGGDANMRRDGGVGGG